MLARAARSLALATLFAAAASAAHAQVTQAKLESWLATYGKAWETRDADLATTIFTPDATYHEAPFDAPKVGRAGIKEYWAGVTADQRDIEFTSDVISAAGKTGVAHWHAKFTANGAPVELDGVFVLDFDAAGLCTRLREWWFVKP
jgi:hypothetical protein